MRGAPTTGPSALTAQTVAIGVSQALKAAGFKGSSREQEHARHALAAHVTGLNAVITFKTLSEDKLQLIWDFIDDLEAVKEFLRIHELHRYQERAADILHPYAMRIFHTCNPQLLEQLPVYLQLRDHIAQELRKADEGRCS